MRFVIVTIVALVTASCALGPDYKRPVIPTPPAFRGAVAASDAGATSLADLRWSQLFRDEVLTGLVANALQQNFDVRIAAERVLQARAVYRINRSEQFPAVDASASVVSTRISVAGANRAIPRNVDPNVSYTEAGFSLGWELVAWGRLPRPTESARAQHFATLEARRGVPVSPFSHPPD